MGKNYLLDTNVIIDYMALNFCKDTTATLSNIIDTSLNLSFISKIEIFVYELSGPEKEIFNDLFELSNIFLINDEIIATTIELRKKYKIKIPDAIIAATCICNNLILLSNNKKDFMKVIELNWLNPHDINFKNEI